SARASAAGASICHSRRTVKAGTVTAEMAEKRTKLKRVFPASTIGAEATRRRARAVPVSSSRTYARGSPVAAEKNRMIQRSAEVAAAGDAGGTPTGPIAKETSVSAVAAKKKTDPSAMRRRSSCAASLEQTAQAREKLFPVRFPPSPRRPVSPSVADWGT